MIFDKLVENVLHYIESRFELFKLEVEESLSSALIGLIRGSVVAVLGTAAVLFVSVGLANLLNHWLQSPYAGYFIMGGLYLLVMFALVTGPGERMLRQNVERGVQQAFEKRRKKTTEGSAEAKSQKPEVVNES
ncbi:MAG: phage holin family protein [Cytophagales bacterium]|jgi:hypothetical protein|nr:phage holin family protein [Cytophagales bacterium]